MPKLGEPLAVQRRLEFTLAPGLTEWTIVCYLDLETRGQRSEPASRSTAIVDYKVKGNPINQQKADRDPQASLYLAGRWLEGRPAEEFTFAQIARPGRQRRQMSASARPPPGERGQLRATPRADRARRHRRSTPTTSASGRDRPWGFADPTSWKCSERFCHFWHACPGGAGL